MQISLDGFAEGPDDEVHWPVVDEELCESSLDDLRGADLFLYGRKTYEIMASFWPTDTARGISPFYLDFARCWKQKPKIVFSRTLRTAQWNTDVIGEDMVERVAALRDRPGCDMVLFGGAETASTFIRHDLVDEYRLFVHPVLLGGGARLFHSGPEAAGLQLVDVMTFDSAVVGMRYQHAARVAS
ncbi:dihydrofolate reductase family protein [Nocardia cyriacigeorgica]|uniref:Dihydrofolate reductase family protein n=2 Tax=Nocardia cyriacigeorgica TaxID=135487 RepID=A0A6P1D6C6_9NOCA|nr:dihydrofolate reductase family protein [Nocardia cyriacigeorgica]NEW45119.1 dihydrofolate reductase family protein [Nocardia cyriacigeorgica]NEW51126.1 dihydrofolate reductase family protein [Nocardia cyriacigeorgica]NEW54291.1 dihydrofolate reductase family protein [Nocardia cyriacigeorgica]